MNHPNKIPPKAHIHLTGKQVKKKAKIGKETDYEKDM